MNGGKVNEFGFRKAEKKGLKSRFLVAISLTVLVGPEISGSSHWISEQRKLGRAITSAWQRAQSGLYTTIITSGYHPDPKPWMRIFGMQLVLLRGETNAGTAEVNASECYRGIIQYTLSQAEDENIC